MNHSGNTYKNQSIMKKIIIVCLGYLCISGINVYADLYDESVYYGLAKFSYGFSSIIIWGVDIWLLLRLIQRRNKRLHLYSAMCGGILSLSLVAGAYLMMKNDLFIEGELANQILAVIGISCLTVPCMEELFMLLDRVKAYAEGMSRSVISLKFWQIWSIIFASYVPVFLAWWPGNFVFDAKYQMVNVIDNWYTTHHPLAHTLLMGKCYLFGDNIGNVSLGFSLYTLIQILFMSFSFAYAVWYVLKRGGNKVTVWMILGWYAFFPMHALMAISATKDVIFAGAFLDFMIYLLRRFNCQEPFGIKQYCGFVLSGILMLLYRNNAIYALVAGGVVMIVLYKGARKKAEIAIVLFIVCLGGNLSNAGLVKATNAAEIDKYRESMSVPIQCMGRVAAYRGSELEEELYNEFILYVETDSIASYNPYLSDPLKNDANEYLLRTNLPNFLKLWVKIGLKYPDEYLESILTNTLGFWYPGKKAVFTMPGVALYHTLIGKGAEIEKKDYFPLANKVYSYLFYEGKYINFPVLSYLFRIDPYIWCMFIVFIWFIYQRKRKMWSCMMIPWMYLLTCFLGPMACLRYVYCLVCIIPLLLFGILDYEDRTKG